MQRVPKMLHWHLLHPSLKTTVGSRYNVYHFFALENCSDSNFSGDIFVLQTMMTSFGSQASDILTCAPMSHPTFWCLLHKLPQLSRTWREKKSFQLLVYLCDLWLAIELLVSSPFEKSLSNLKGFKDWGLRTVLLKKTLISSIFVAKKHNMRIPRIKIWENCQWGQAASCAILLHGAVGVGDACFF